MIATLPHSKTTTQLPVYLLADAELLAPGDIRHEVVTVTRDLTRSQQRKILTLTRMTVSGEFDILQTITWSDDQRRAFIESLPEAEA
jgi:hypothetical protein